MNQKQQSIQHKTVSGRARSTHLFLGVGVILISLFASLFNPLLVSAKTLNEMNLDEKTQSYLYYEALTACLSYRKAETGGLVYDTIQDSEAASGHWFNGNGSNVIGYGYYDEASISDRRPTNNDGVTCDDIVRLATTLWGYADPLDMLCSIWHRVDGTFEQACVNDPAKEKFLIGAAESVDRESVVTSFHTVIKQRIYGGNEPVETDAMTYLMYAAAFFSENGCSAKAVSPGEIWPDKLSYSANYVSWQNTTTKYFHNGQEVDPQPQSGALANAPAGYYTLETTTTNEPRLMQNASFYGIDNSNTRLVSIVHGDYISCSDIAYNMSNYASGYLDYLSAHQSEWPSLANADQVAFCATHRNDPSCHVDNAASSCAVEGIGWIVCPVMNFMGSISDIAYDFISNSFLKVDVGLVNTTLPNNGGVNPTYSTWQTFRNIANVLFVIVFLIIVFSQLTSAGISNYGVKKMLPRLVIAAILVNASYFIAQIAVDISNILGYGLKSLFETLPIYSSATTNPTEVIGQGLTWVGIIGGALVAGVALLLAISMPVLLAALLSVLMIVLILIGRQALIVLLIILSPIAFVAWLLPNTEQYFKKWWKMFFTLLMVFPIVGVLFGASKLAATVLQAVGAGKDNKLMQVIAMGVATIPLIMTPSLLKGALSATGSLGAKLSGISSKLNSKVGGKVKSESRLGEAMKNRQINNVRNRASRRTKAGSLQSKLDSSRVGRSLGFDRGARVASQIADKAFEEEVAAAEVLQKDYTIGQANEAALKGKVNGKPISNAERTAAARKLMKVGTSNDRREMYAAAGAAGVSDSVRRAAKEGFFANGDQKIYGAPIADTIASGGVTQESALDDAIVAQINGDGFAAETLVQDARIATRIATLATERGDISAGGRARLAASAANAIAGDSTRGKITGPMATDINTIANLAGAPQGTPAIEDAVVQTSQAPGETFVDLRSRPTMSDLERAEAEELERRRNNPS